jgi:hypothetical protein
MATNYSDIQGLNSQQVILAREKFGENKLNYKKENSLLDAVKRIIQDPMIILLLDLAFILSAEKQVMEFSWRVQYYFKLLFHYIKTLEVKML